MTEDVTFKIFRGEPDEDGDQLWRNGRLYCRNG